MPSPGALRQGLMVLLWLALAGPTAAADAPATAATEYRIAAGPLVPALQQWAAQLPFAVAIVAVAEQALPAQAVVTQSPRLLARYGTGSVAEAVALSAAAPAPRLLLARLGAGDGRATLAAALRERARVALNSGPSFGAGGAGHARLNLACAPEVLEEAVARIARFAG